MPTTADYEHLLPRALTTVGLIRRIQPSSSVARYESRVGHRTLR